MAIIQLARLSLAHLPTPIESLPRLSAHLRGPQLSIKRDDLTGLAFGGNKTRKLEFLLAEAQAHGAGMLITRGARQSNHCRQTAAAAARYGLACSLVLAGEPMQQPDGNLLLDQLLGAELVWARGRDPQVVLEETFQAAWAEGRRPYLIPYGGSSPSGATGYALAMKELMEQGALCDRIVVASSSGGTQAGLLVGARAYGFDGQILGISIDKPADELKVAIAELATQTALHIGLEASFVPSDVIVHDGFVGEGYGVVGGLEREAILLFARQEGIMLDPVYTGRAAGGMIELIRSGEFDPAERVVFWHTGGTPALFAYASDLGS